MDENAAALQQGMYGKMLGATPPPTGGNPLAMASAVQPNPLVEAPATSPEELSSRKDGWDTIMSNPNFSRALLMAGSYLAQPMGYGQNTVGHLAGAMAMGGTAYQAGQYSDWERKLKESEEARKTAESAANVDSTRANTSLTQARTPGAEADSAVAVGTKAIKIEDAALKLKSAKNEAQVKEAENAIALRRAQILKEIPDEKVRAAEMAKVDAAALAADEARARLGLAKAQTLHTEAGTKELGVKTGTEQLTLDTLKGMDSTELKQFLTKTGKYQQHTSGIGQQATMWGDIYDKLPANDPSKKGFTREQFQMQKLESAKGQDALKLLTDYMKNTLDPDPEIVQIYTDAAKAAGSKRPGAGAAAPSTPGAEVWVRDKSGKLVKKDQSAPATPAAKPSKPIEPPS